MTKMNIDDLLYSLRTAASDDAKALLQRIDAADAALKATPRGRQHALAYGRAESARDVVRREAAKIVEERGWFRRLPTDGYDGSYFGHEDH